MRARSATARCKDQITADISCYCARVQQHHDCGLLLNRTGSMQAAAECVECTAGTRVPRSGLTRVFVCVLKICFDSISRSFLTTVSTSFVFCISAGADCSSLAISECPRGDAHALQVCAEVTHLCIDHNHVNANGAGHLRDRMRPYAHPPQARLSALAPAH